MSTTVEFTVPKLACAACVTTVTKAIHSLDPAATIEADPRTKRVRVQSTTPEAALRDVLATVGYPVATS
ncbi:MAG: hypothetical protein OHK0012_00310 [Synechococcales cyanobacterium]